MATTPTTLAQGILPMLDALRGLRGELGFALISVTVRVVTWPGNAPGQGGAATIVNTPLYVATATGSPQNPRVVQMKDHDALASGGLYTNQMVKVGPLTPAFAASIANLAGGYAASAINPPTSTTGCQEIFFKLAGAGFQFPVWFKRVGDEVERATRYFIVLERSGDQNPGGVP